MLLYFKLHVRLTHGNWLTHSIRQRWAEVIQATGRHTQYWTFNQFCMGKNLFKCVNREYQSPRITFLQQQNGPVIFQQDRAGITQAFLQHHNVHVMNPWPAHSPDLNVIKHVWSRIGLEVKKMHPPPTTLVQLEQNLITAWNNIPQADIARLVHSMRRRCAAVIDANGGNTRY